ncbi:GNAT family N-acetyltransferase [Propionibacteriaceae bacterium Y2011]
MSLILRPPESSDEPRCRELHAQLALEDFEFLHRDGPWAQVLAETEREARGVDLPEGRVPCDFLLAEVDGVIIGRVSIRRALNDFLLEVGGHVGYAVAPEHRRRGHATEILRQSVARLADAGVTRVLVTCDDDNIASAAVIEACGGVLEDVRTAPDAAPKRRYWIQATTAAG